MNNDKNNNKDKGIVAIFTVLTVLCATLFLISVFDNTTPMSDIEEVSYREFLEMVRVGEIDTVYYTNDTEYMKFTLLNDNTAAMTKSERKGYNYVASDYRKCLYPKTENFRESLLLEGVNLVVSDNKTAMQTFASTAPSIVWAGLSVGILLFLLIRMGNMLTPVKTTIDIAQNTDVRFKDVIGHDEILTDIKFWVQVLKNPKVGEVIGAKPPKGILFSGQPGTGKTLIAKALAGEAGVPFIYMNASNFIEMYVGVGAKRVRELFKKAKENAPCIVFIDEIDAIGQDRTADRSTSSEDTQTINALLQEMDGFAPRKGVLIIAATNNSQVLDKALTRAGRFDREIVIGPPKDWHVRSDLFKHFTEELKLAEDVNVELLSKETPGFTGADISSITNEASLIALSRILSKDDNTDSADTTVVENKTKPNKSKAKGNKTNTPDIAFAEDGTVKIPDGVDVNICMADFEEAIDKLLLKGNRTRKSNQKEQELVAWHEAGHAVMSYLRGQPIARATIQGTTSGVGGFVLHSDKETKLETKESFENSIMVCYAGRAAEAIKYGNEKITTGASNDITQATQRLLAYVEAYGFDDTISGLLDLQVISRDRVMTGNVTYERVAELSKKFYERTYNLLKENRGLLDKLAMRLLTDETVSGSEIEKLLEG